MIKSKMFCSLMFAGMLAFVNVAHASVYNLGHLQTKEHDDTPSFSFKDDDQLSKDKSGSHEKDSKSQFGRDGFNKFHDDDKGDDKFKSGNGRSGEYTPITAAVPEPETYAMILAGLGLIGFAARRRNRNV